MKAWNKVGAPIPHPKENAPQRFARPGRFCVQWIQEKRLLLIREVSGVIYSLGYDGKQVNGAGK